MEAFKFYWDLGEFYFGLVTKNKGVLPAAKACFIIAAENLNAVSNLPQLSEICMIDQLSYQG